MEIGNNELARILGRMEANLQALAQTTARVERAVDVLDDKVTQRLDEHDKRLRQLEVANPAALGEAVADHAKRIEALEKGAARAGVIAGIGSAAGMAVLVELLKKKLGM